MTESRERFAEVVDMKRVETSVNWSQKHLRNSYRVMKTFSDMSEELHEAKFVVPKVM